MHFRGVILEGNSNAGKTSILKELKMLNAQNDGDERSLIVLSEHYTQILNNVQGTFVRLDQREHYELLQKRVKGLSELLDWVVDLGPGRRTSRGLFFILERFHLNHLVAFGDSAVNDIQQIEKQLDVLGAKCFLMTISDELVRDRIESRDSDAWKDKDEKYIAEVCQDFCNSQDIYRLYAKKSSIETVEINTDNRDWKRIASQIMEVM